MFREARGDLDMNTKVRSLLIVISVAAIAAAVRLKWRDPSWLTALCLLVAIAAGFVALRRPRTSSSIGFAPAGRRSRWEAVRRALHLCMCLGVLTPTARGDDLSPAQKQWLAGAYVLPDKLYVDARCTKVGELAKKDTESGVAIRHVLTHCAEARAGSMSVSEWVEVTEPLIAQILAREECDNCLHAELTVRQEIPRNLKTYTMFLAPSEAWRSAVESEDLADLRRGFLSFGESIGPAHGAIWLADRMKVVDVIRSQSYCDRFNLDYDDGPYLVFTEVRPDLTRKAAIVLRLDGIGPDGAVRIMEALAQDLRREKKPSKTGLLLRELGEFFKSLAEKHPEIVKRIIFGS